MPLYPMVCKACGHKFEDLASIKEGPPKVCPACKKRKLEQELTVPAVHMYWSPMHPRAKRGRGH